MSDKSDPRGYIMNNVGGMFQRHEARSHVDFDFDIISAAVNQE